jgi:outer membrane scaffolding protein for murein synthesis (MipA/OmpV family)
MIVCGRASAQEVQATDEISITAERQQTALDAEALSISDTPDAEPHTPGISAIVGLGAMIAPAYEGSKSTKTSPYPYVDVHGFFNDRVYLSSVRGIGVNLLDTGPVRGGLALNYAGSRTSSDDPHLKGLPDISGAAQLGGFLTYSFKPFAVEARVRHRFGSSSGTQVGLGATVAAAPVPRLHLSLGADLTWADARYQKTFFGVTPSEAAQATSQGNPLTAYTPGSGLTTVGVTAAGIYQIGTHWGLVARIELQDLIGKQAKDSPLTQRTFQPGFAFGALYKF